MGMIWSSLSLSFHRPMYPARADGSVCEEVDGNCVCVEMGVRPHINTHGGSEVSTSH